MATIFTVTRDIEVEGSDVEIEVTASHDEGSEYESFTLNNVGEKVLDEYAINIDKDDIEEMDEAEVVSLLTSLNATHPVLMQRIYSEGTVKAHTVEAPEPETAEPAEPELELSTVADWFGQENNNGRLAELISELLDRNLSKTRAALITAVAKHLGGM